MGSNCNGGIEVALAVDDVEHGAEDAVEGDVEADVEPDGEPDGNMIDFFFVDVDSSTISMMSSPNESSSLRVTMTFCHSSGALRLSSL